MEKFGERIKYIRYILNLSQKQLAVATDTKLSTVNAIELNRYIPPRQFLAALEKRLKVSSSFIMTSRPPIFLSKIAFILINSKFLTKYISAIDVSEKLLYLLDIEKPGEIVCFMSYFLFAGRKSLYIVKSDEYSYPVCVEKIDTENIKIYDLDNISKIDNSGETKEYIDRISNSINNVYNYESLYPEYLFKVRQLSSELVELRESVEMILHDDIQILRDFESVCSSIKEGDIITPLLIIESNKSEQIASFLKEIEATREDVEKALSILKMK